MTRAQLIRRLNEHNACPSAMRWIARHPKMTPQQLWTACRNIPYLSWYVAAVTGEKGVDYDRLSNWRNRVFIGDKAFTAASFRTVFPRISAIGKEK